MVALLHLANNFRPIIFTDRAGIDDICLYSIGGARETNPFQQLANNFV